MRFFGGNICIKEIEIMIEKKFICDFILNSDVCYKGFIWFYLCDICSCLYEGDVSIIYIKLCLGLLRFCGLIFVVKVSLLL